MLGGVTKKNTSDAGQSSWRRTLGGATKKNTSDEKHKRTRTNARKKSGNKMVEIEFYMDFFSTSPPTTYKLRLRNSNFILEFKF